MIDKTTPLVFLHAYPLNSTMWAPQREHFRDRTTFAPDLPGFGGAPADSRTLDDFAERVLDAVRAAGIDRAVFIGLSMGGYTAFRIWEKAPEVMAGLVLADTRGGSDAPAAAEKRTAQAERARDEGIGWLADEMIPALLAESTRAERPDVEATVRRMIEDANVDGVARALIAMRDRPDSTPLLASIDVPVLAIVGEHDVPTPPAEAVRIAGSVPRGRLVVISRAGHLTNLENPTDFNEAISAFLDEHGGR